jgi:hypothetical protein
VIKVPKSLRAAVDDAVARGWTLGKTRRHLKLTKPGCRMVVFPLTPSDRRGLMNLRADLRRSERGR